MLPLHLMEARDIIIAEDDSFLSGMLRSTLEQHGIVVREASDGKRALAMVREREPALILLDILMPKMSGYAMLKELRRHHPDVPVIVLTNIGEWEARRRCTELGIDRYIVKSDMDESDIWKIVRPYVES